MLTVQPLEMSKTTKGGGGGGETLTKDLLVVLENPPTCR